MQEWQERIEKRLDRIEQQTEPMRLEHRLSIPEANTLQKIMEQVGHQAADIGIMKGDIGVLKTDVSVLKNDMGKAQADISTIKNTLATQGKTLDQILKLLQQKSGG